MCGTEIRDSTTDSQHIIINYLSKPVRRWKNGGGSAGSPPLGLCQLSARAGLDPGAAAALSSILTLVVGAFWAIAGLRVAALPPGAPARAAAQATSGRACISRLVGMIAAHEPGQVGM